MTMPPIVRIGLAARRRGWRCIDAAACWRDDVFLQSPFLNATGQQT
jgi:hypothetical protein